MSSPAVKFTFDLDLGKREEKRPPPLGEDVIAGLVADARSSAYAEGLAAGQQSETANAARRLAAAAEAIGDRVAALAAAVDDVRKTTLSEAVDLAAAVAKKLAANLVAQQPAAELEALLAECLASLNGVPHLVIRCHPDLADCVRSMAEARMHASGFTGRLVVIGEPEIALGDCRLEWADGGLVRDSEVLAAEIDTRIAKFLAARGINNGAPGAGETE